MKLSSGQTQVFQCPRRMSFCCAPAPIFHVAVETKPANCYSQRDLGVLGSRLAQKKTSSLAWRADFLPLSTWKAVSILDLSFYRCCSLQYGYTTVHSFTAGWTYELFPVCGISLRTEDFTSLVQTPRRWIDGGYMVSAYLIYL